MVNDISEKKHFNKISKIYDIQYGYENEFTKYKIKNRIESLKKIIPNNSAINILEVGCGTGEYTKLLSDIFPKAHIYAFDISPEMIRIAKRKCLKNNNITFSVQSAYKINYNIKFDYIVGFYIFHHLNFALFYSQIPNLLKKKGGFIFFEPNILNPIVFIIKNIPFLKRMVGDSKNEYAINPITIKNEFLGLEIKELFTQEFIFPINVFNLKTLKKINNLFNLLSKTPLLKYLGGTVFLYAKK